jgi:hypothetical protein
LILILLLLASLAYQFRFPIWVDVGTLGDRAYLWASRLGEELGFNGDEHLADEGYNYRWTKKTSWIRFPDVAWTGPLRVQVQLRGWRPPGQPLPPIEIRVNGVRAGSFVPSGSLESRTYEFETYPGQTADIEVLLEGKTFIPAGEDKRTLGVQLDWVRLDPLPGAKLPVLPPWRQLLLWGAVVALIYGGLRRHIGGKAFWLVLGLATLIAVGLTFVRHWLTPYASWAFYAAGTFFLLNYVDRVFPWIPHIQRRARTLPFLTALIGTGLVVTLAYVRWAISAVPRLGPRPDAILLVIFFATACLYALLTWNQPVQRLLARLDKELRRPWLPAVILVLILAGVTLYEFSYIQNMQFVGHADYADNAVVARNLIAGRGFIVDYVTQFYQVHPGITHPQETWPLMQPVLIAPFFKLLGTSAFAAKVPNLLLQLGLALAIYILGSEFFDRRVALIAVILTILNKYIFRLIIFPTSDLAFTLLALLTVGQFFRASEQERHGRPRMAAYVWAGIWAGLMALAKPNGVLFAGICVLWDLFWRWREYRWRGLARAWLAFGVPAAALFAPWVVRNLILFGTPVHSTESYDAWILKYQEWEEIYRIYFDDLPERSWLLRYGFDRILQAIGAEFRRWWYYFSRSGNALLTLPGSALALGGLLTLRRKAARLYSLVGAIFFLFGTFICTYWHVEERYFLPFIPWLAVLIGHGLWRIHDALAYSNARHFTDDQSQTAPPEAPEKPFQKTTGFGWLGLTAIILACFHLVTPFSQEAAAKINMDQAKALEIQAYRWLAEHSEPDDVVMTRVPWQVSYYTERRAVMIPQDGLQDALQIIELYGVDYLLIDGDGRGKRAALNQALRQDGPYRLVYDENGVQIYQVDGP